MSELLGFYIGGETKTGKGAAGLEVSRTLESHGLKVYYDVGGDFFRRYTAMVRLELGLGEDEPLPEGDVLETTAQRLYETGRCFEMDDSLGDLQRPAIGNSTSVLSKLALVQKAGEEWFVATAKNAWQAGADALVLDGRNPRGKMRAEKLGEVSIRTAFDLYLTCLPREAARRTLLALGVTDPTPEQIDEEEVKTKNRRDLDLNRAINPFKMPEIFETFVPGENVAEQIVEATWRKHGAADLPVAVVLDNTNISKPEMLGSVSELALAAVKFSQTSDMSDAQEVLA